MGRIRINIWIVVMLLIVVFFVMKSCEDEPKITVQTKTITKIVTDKQMPNVHYDLLELG